MEKKRDIIRFGIWDLGFLRVESQLKLNFSAIQTYTHKLLFQINPKSQIPNPKS